ncbi:HGxxPAAW family protein [Streptomyces sp. NPDC048606]|uniref:HGxxPAAW family protein n=1 Tax=Streptomyces sp. NPDC048606 TaxID=3154726 RepID=UPI0034175745
MSAHGHVDLGHTVAGWTGTTLALLGTAGAGAALCAAWTPGIWLGLGLVVAAGLVTWLLHLAGWGKPSGPRPESQWDWRTRDTSARTGHVDCLGCRLAGSGRGGVLVPAAVPAPVSAAAPASRVAAPSPVGEGGTP